MNLKVAGLSRSPFARGLSVLPMVMLASVAWAADNTVVASAKGVPVNTGISDFVAVASGSKFYWAQLFANRSYELLSYPSALPFDCPTGNGQGLIANLVVSTDSTFATTLTSTYSSSALEGTPNASIFCNHSGSLRFTTTASGVHYFRGSAVYSTGNVNILLRETTLFSPWLSRAAGFEGFNEIHNNSSAAISVTLRAYDSTGALQGAGLTFSIPANATVFKTGADIGVPAGVAVGVVLTHNGAFGSISGNITTLSGAAGLSFDSPFAPRTDSIRLH